MKPDQGYGEKSTEIVAAGARDEYEAELMKALSTAEATLQVARGVAETLDEQGESLADVETTLRSTEGMLEKSLHMLRGMTWRGAMLNVLEALTARKSQVSESKPELRKEHDIVEVVRYQPAPLFVDDPRNSEPTLVLCRSVRELRECGGEISNKIKANNQVLERISLKQDITLEKTFELTAQTTAAVKAPSSKMTQLFIQVLGDYCFSIMGSIAQADYSFYLATHGTSLILNYEDPDSPKAVFTLFYCAEGGFYGIQSKLTKRFLGVNWRGQVSFNSNTLDRNERVMIYKLSEGRDGVFMLAANWGRGGWLRRRYSSVSKGLEDKAEILTIGLQAIGETNNYTKSHSL